MTILSDVYRAGVDAVIADNTLNQNGFENACQTIATGINNVEVDAWVTALYTEYNRLDLINNPTYGNFRNDIIGRGQVSAMDLFDALRIDELLESIPVNEDVTKITLRAERDEIDTSIATMQAFRPGQTRQVKDAINAGIDWLKKAKSTIKSTLQAS